MSLPFVFPKTRTSISGSSIHMQREASVSISDRYLRICFKPRAYVRWNFDHHFLEETTLRTCMYLYFTFQYTCVESFSGIACENIDKYLFLRALQTYLLRFFSGIFSLGKPTLRTVFLIALFCFHACRKHDICWYICHVSTMFPCLNADLLKCLFFYHFCLGGSCLFFLFRSKHLAFKRFCGLYLLTSYCLRKPHLEQNWIQSYLPQMQGGMLLTLTFFQRRSFTFEFTHMGCYLNYCLWIYY